MDDLIEALTIFRKYIEVGYGLQNPTHCEHDALFVLVAPSKVSPEDTARLKVLGFSPEGTECFRSYRFGSA